MLRMIFKNANSAYRSPFFLLGLLVTNLISLQGCQTLVATKYDRVPKDRASQVSNNKHIFVNEGQKIPIANCQEVNENSPFLLGKYIAQLQGNLTVIQDNCLHQDQLWSDLKEELQSSHPSSSSYGLYETYRRGPLWPAIFLASLDAALKREKISLGSLNREVAEADTSTLFQNTITEEVSVQSLKFNFGPSTHCIAKLKHYQEETRQERRDRLSEKNQRIKLNASLSKGNLWAEYKQTRSGGYELLIIEKRLAEDRGEGEVREIELLCVNPQDEVKISDSYFSFSYQDTSRQITRVFAWLNN